MSLPLLPILPNVLENIDISRAERAKLRAEKRLKKPKISISVDMERRAKIALQRAINRINVGNRL